VLLRKMLVGFQFCLANIVLIAAVLVTQQVNYFFGGRLGYDKEYVSPPRCPETGRRRVPRKW
jgi:putative ABC transport system permease protein